MKGPLVDVSGAVDLHCHPAPDLFPRLADDIDVAQDAAGRAFRAVMIKCHFEPTASRAAHVRRMVPGIEVFGGIVLNHAVGGVNPAAVESALRMGAREVWMPTVDARYHAEVHGGTGGYDAQQSGGKARPGIAVVAREGELTPETLEVLDLVAQHDAILGTCHLSPAEILALVSEARRRGVQRITVTHPFFKVPNLSLEELTQVVALGAYAEFGYCTISPMWGYATPKRVSEAVLAIGAERCLLVSDAGQRHNPMPAEALRIFAQSLFESGVSEEEISTMIRTNPSELLDLGPAPVIERAVAGGGMQSEGAPS
ncbi:MAG TPA: hypothetical protein DIT48_03225 [Actinobacteria bacterium]|jgi:hypothetical protein|nr:hypothetical protein [Actinomycetota bacterium]